MKQRATFIKQDDYTEVMFPYDRAIVEDFKASIPWDQRWWKPEVKAWAVELQFHSAAIRFFVDRGYDVLEVQPVSWRTPSSTSVHSSAHEILHVTPDAPIEVVKAAYRALIRLYHPDVGGDTETMQEINKSYRKITS